MKIVRNEIILFVVVLVGCRVVLGQTSTDTTLEGTSIRDAGAIMEVENDSMIEERSFFDVMSDTFAVNYYGIYRGASLMDPRNSLQPRVDGSADSNNPQSLESTVFAGYKFNNDWNGGILGHFNYFPVGNPVGNGQDIQMLDPSLAVSIANLFERGHFKVSSRLTAQLPVSSQDVLRPNHLLTALTTYLFMNYEVPHSKVTLGIAGYLRGYIPDANALDSVRTYRIYVAPNVNYQITQSVAATLWIDLLQLNRSRGTHFISGVSNDPIDIEPGINWDISKNFSINPVINIYPAHPTLASTSFQAFIVARTS